MIKIPPMRQHIRLILIIPRVPIQIDIPIQCRHVRRRRHHPRHRIDVVLGADVHKAQRSWRQPRHRVVVVRGAVVAAGLLVGDVVAEHGAGDARRAVGVEVGGGAGLADLGGGDVGDGAAEAVPDDGHAVGGVLVGGGEEGGEDAGARFEPAVVAVGGLLVVAFFWDGVARREREGKEGEGEKG